MGSFLFSSSNKSEGSSVEVVIGDNGGDVFMLEERRGFRGGRVLGARERVNSDLPLHFQQRKMYFSSNW